MEHAFLRAEDDPTFLDAVRTAYRGHWDVLDALWWLAHPEEPSPSGTPSPTTLLRELQRRVFSAGGDAVGDQAASASVRRLEEEISTERRAISVAIAETDGAPRPVMVVESVPAPVERPAETAPPAQSRRTLVLALVALAALVAGIALGSQLNAGTADAKPVPAATPSSASTAGPPLALGVFDRAQEPNDIPALPLPGTFDSDSVRLLAEAADGSTENVYAAKTTSQMVCLVVSPGETDYLSTCTLANEFPLTGLRLYFTSTFQPHSEEGVASAIPMDTYLVWNSDATLESGGTGREPRL